MAHSKSNFISYISQSVSEIPSRKSSFKSYIENTDEIDGYNVEQVEESASEFFDMELQPNLQPGERVIGEADSVLKFVPYSDGKQGMSGKLCATNFKLSFVTADRSSYDSKGKRQRNKLLDEDDIPLTYIDAIYHVTRSGKRKKLSQGTTTSSRTEILEIHCKDFRIHKFSFKFCVNKTQSKQFINVLVHHAFPTKDSLLFSHEYARNTELTGRQLLCEVPMFDNIHDWEEEIQRCKCMKNWRVADVNISFEMSQSLPQYFVVPSALMNADLQRAAPQFKDRRIPTWCYTHINGNGLVRMSAQDDNSDQTQLQKRMLDAVKVAGNQRNSPKVIDMAECCPSCREVQESFAKLKKLCMSDTEREFYVQDLTWYSSLDDTKWLQMVSKCLSASHNVADYIVTNKRTVVIQEQSGCDLSCLVSSVVQILLDPYYRTQLGFEALIQKEWVRMGHPFQRNLGLVGQNESELEQVPIFLLYLDCVWQLLQQFPSSFEFTETYLTTVWDTAHVGIFETFLFNNDHQKVAFLKGAGKNIRQFRLPSAWKWDMQFRAEDLSFFKNPLYVITHDEELSESLTELRQMSVLGRCSQRSRHNTLTGPPKVNGSSKSSTVQNGIDQYNVLTPLFSAASLHLWTQCFLRWQMPAQIFSGGTPSLYLQQCHMVEEIIQLQHKANQLQLKNTSAGMFRPRSDLIFGHDPDTPNITELLNSTVLTSSFPFTPGTSSKDQQRFTFTPTISTYMRNTSLDFDRFLDADD
ncbi:myotubularin-related protein 10-B-like isoform X2 [Mercenaria mercenaria]|uniref:myotubularin-related protein 10-B-like isoform X2 n=1 Tax=Mercenaria mercenaria TaxID=6596 RepID=UPI00234EE53F|nr:myotubularin-related protein 10-B-like isoform X2 [Mercenaria mercenaria]